MLESFELNDFFRFPLAVRAVVGSTIAGGFTFGSALGIYRGFVCALEEARGAYCTLHLLVHLISFEGPQSDFTISYLLCVKDISLHPER